MRTRTIVGLTVVLFFCTLSTSSLPVALAATSEIVDAGNKFCPVSGDKVSGKFFVTYQGKRYGLCCPMCENKFKANPEKYIAQMMQQEKEAS